MSVAVHNACQEHFCDQVYQAGAAQAHRRATVNGACEHGWFPAGNSHAIDSAASGPHAAGDRAALESRTRRGRTGNEKIAVSQYHFAIGANV